MTPEQFYAQYLPYAQSVSQRTGLDPRLVLAQSALETGYGKSAPNMNFFGIKSHGRKGGSTLGTQEFEGGRMVQQPASFRGYETPEQSFADYGDFITSNPRYKGVLEADGLEAQIAAMAKSGYATDPNYGSKLASIASRFDPNSPKVIAAETMRLLGKGPQAATVSTQGAAPMMPQEKQQPRGLLEGFGVQRRDETAGGETAQPFYQRDSFKDTAAILAQGFGRMGVMGMEEIADDIAKQRTENKARNKTLEMLGKMGTPQAQAAVEYINAGGDPVSALKMAFEKPKATAKEQQIQRLMSTGVPENIAIGIADGRLVVSRDPVTQEAVIVDKAQLMSPGASPTAPVEVSPQEAETAGKFEGANVRGALGASGFAANIVNTVADAFGKGQPADKISDAATALESLGITTMLGLSAEFPGRPSNLTREKIEQLTVKPGELALGPDKALNKVQQMVQTIEQSLAAANNVVQSRASPTDKAAAEQSIRALTPLLADYNSLVAELQPTTPAASGGAAIRKDVLERMGDYR